MESYWVVTLFHLHPTADGLHILESQAIEEYEALGIEEYSLSEEQVDEILGERSYSGGDLPLEVLDEVEFKVLNKARNYRFFFSNPELAKSFKDFVSQEYLCESQLEECPQEDWNAEWKKHYSPIKVNDLLEVVPSWQQDYLSSSQKKIFIYPGMGFGTGSHETTFLCLKLFTEEVLNQNISHVLDFGSGSGILGLSTLLFFPKLKVDFYDIDPEANKNCFHNAEINKLTERSFKLLLPEVRESLQTGYQLVFANILESILLEERASLINHTLPGGHLILSGLLKQQVDGIIERYSSNEMKLIRREDKGDWSALLFKKEIE